jgi:energy-coupling factor transporter ATP-binding protein EcfA2
MAETGCEGITEMAAVAKRTHKLSITRLKGIRDLAEISFEDKDLTGIFGPNGAGKTTILQALAAAYNCPAGCQSAHYRDFFPKLADDIWNGTRFTIEHTYWAGTATAKGSVGYKKGTATTCWSPLISNRPKRHVVYIGVKSCLPDLEAFHSHNLSCATPTVRTGATDNAVRSAAGIILNCNYTEIADVTAPYHPKRKYRSLTRGGTGAVTYPSVTMGAGEQRLLKLLYAVEEVRDYGLILVDELDLMLHGDALKKLVNHLVERCSAKHLQVVFTSHREELLSLKDKINIRHLNPQDGKHVCYANTDPDSLYRMTGRQETALEIFVEDDVAQTITSHVVSNLGLSRYTRIRRFGSAENAFSVLAALLLKGDDCSNSLFVLDGDVLLIPSVRQKCINESFVGNDATARLIRDKMSTLIKDFTLPAGMKPEPYLHGLICAQDLATMSPAETEIANAARDIVNPSDSRQFINDIVTRLGGDRERQLDRIIPLAAKKNPEWDTYTAPVRDWLTAKKTELHL